MTTDLSDKFQEIAPMLYSSPDLASLQYAPEGEETKADNLQSDIDKDSRSLLAINFEKVSNLVGNHPTSFAFEDLWQEHSLLLGSMLSVLIHGTEDFAQGIVEEGPQYHQQGEFILRLMVGVDPFSGRKLRGRHRKFDLVELSKQLSQKESVQFSAEWFRSNVENGAAFYNSIKRVIKLSGFWEELFSKKDSPLTEDWREVVFENFEFTQEPELMVYAISPAYEAKKDSRKAEEIQFVRTEFLSKQI